MGTSPAIALKSVVLPAPFGPMIARRSPSRTPSEMPSTARSAPKLTARPSSSISFRIS
jgi:hypothetical protein